MLGNKTMHILLNSSISTMFGNSSKAATCNGELALCCMGLGVISLGA